MQKKTAHSRQPANPATCGRDSEFFPTTQSKVLLAAAQGDFQAFCEYYLRPCWREVVLICRQKGLSIADPDDVYQELMLRLLDDGAFGAKAQREDSALRSVRANIPARYLLYRGAHPGTAKFRTYLKRVIENLVLESLRREGRHRRRRVELDLVSPVVEQSLSETYDPRWSDQCVAEAIGLLAKESREATTKGVRRWFKMLRFALADGLSIDQIAQRFDIERSVASRQLAEAKQRLLLHMRRLTGIQDEARIRAVMRRSMRAVQRAFALETEASSRIAPLPTNPRRRSPSEEHA